MATNTADAIVHCFESPSEADSNLQPANVVDGLFAISRGLHAVAEAIHALGNNHAIDPSLGKHQYGALEFFGMKLTEALGEQAQTIADALGAVQEGK